MKWTNLIAFLLLVIWTVCAQTSVKSRSNQNPVVWGPPNLHWPSKFPQPTAPKEIITDLKVGGWPIVLETTELLSAQKRLGGTVGYRGDASEALAWICLYRLDENAAWVLWLYSGEIDGPAIGGFQWQRLENGAKMDRRCKALNAKMGTVELLPSPLHLGMTEAEVEGILGKPTRKYHDSVLYDHEHNLTIRKEPYTLDNDVLIVYKDGKVWAISANHTTSS